MFGLFKKMRTAALLLDIQNALVRITRCIVVLRGDDGFDDMQLEQFYLWIMENRTVRAVYNKTGGNGFTKGNVFEIKEAGDVCELGIDTPVMTIPIKSLGLGFDWEVNPLWGMSSKVLKDIQLKNRISDDIMNEIEEDAFMLTQFLYREFLWRIAP